MVQDHFNLTGIPDQVLACLSRPRRQSIEDWLPVNFRFDARSGALPGYWSHVAFPYSLGPIRALEDPDVKEVVMCWGTRLGKTAIVTGYVAWCTENDPCPTQITCPDQDSANEHYDTKLEPALEACESTAARLLPKHRRLKERVDLGSQYIYYGWLGAPRTLAARSIAKQIISEANKGGYTKTLEGDPIRQARDRGKDWMISPSYKLIIEGTPTLIGECRITSALDESNKCRYNVPCPHCWHFQPLLMGDRDSPGGLKWERLPNGKSDPDLALRTAYYQCEKCAGRIMDHHKILINRRGVWVPEGQTARLALPNEKSTTTAADGTEITLVGEPLKPKRVSGFGPLPSMHSSLLTFGLCAKDWIDSKHRGIAALQNHFNSWLGQAFDLRGKRVSSDDILSHRLEEMPLGYVPFEQSVLIVAVDVQKECLYYTLRAWTIGGRSHLLRYGCLPQDSGRMGTDFQKLDRILQDPYRGANQTEHRPQLVLIDSGYEARQTEVYDWCQSRQPWAIPCKGRKKSGMGDQLNLLQVSKVPDRGDMPLWRVSPYHGNNELFDRVMQIKSGDDGYWSLHADTGLDYAGHFTTVSRTRKKNKLDGSERTIWEQIGELDHYRDCELLQLAARDHHGLTQMRAAPKKESAHQNQSRSQSTYSPPRRADGRGWLDR
jgi:phage terminase large subunit GpA-like protein